VKYGAEGPRLLEIAMSKRVQTRILAVTILLTLVALGTCVYLRDSASTGLLQFYAALVLAYTTFELILVTRSYAKATSDLLDHQRSVSFEFGVEEGGGRKLQLWVANIGGNPLVVTRIYRYFDDLPQPRPPHSFHLTVPAGESREQLLPDNLNDGKREVGVKFDYVSSVRPGTSGRRNFQVNVFESVKSVQSLEGSTQ
jgi:hypothetical protein